MGEAGRRGVLGRSWEALCEQLIGRYEAVADTTVTAALDPLDTLRP